MSFLKGIISLFAGSGTSYQINRDVLAAYIEEQIAFGKENKLSLCDEFFLKTDEAETDRIHISIINYDVECKTVYEVEKHLSGVILFANHETVYNPESDEKFYSADELIRSKLFGFPEEFIFTHEMLEPISLEAYKIH